MAQIKNLVCNLGNKLHGYSQFKIKFWLFIRDNFPSSFLTKTLFVNSIYKRCLSVTFFKSFSGKDIKKGVLPMSTITYQGRLFICLENIYFLLTCMEFLVVLGGI
jgi:hypothetical protein